jgi:hypothetical protein
MLDFLFGDRPQRRTPTVNRRPSARGRGKQSVTFVCVPSIVPYEVIQYLESLGVKAVPAASVDIAEDGTRTATVYVSAGQYAYAAGLVAGLAPGSVAVLEPHNVAPITPRTRWGKTNKARGPIATLLRGTAWYFGVEAKKPPVKGKR